MKKKKEKKAIVKRYAFKRFAFQANTINGE